ncbi:MAG: TspO/MBR family protein [Coprobacillus sp.]
MEKIFDLIICILLTVLLGSLSGLLVGNMTMDYNELIKPFYSPPSIVFPIVWTILYVLLGISFYLALQGKEKKKVIIVYSIQMFLNITWSFLFFGLHKYLLSSIWILLLISSIVLMMYVFYNINPLSAYLQIPYLLWCIFAFILNFHIFLLNK